MYEEGAGLIPGQAKVRSLELQMDVGLRFPWPHQSASVRVFAGPRVGFELSCKVRGSVLGMTFNEDCNEPVVGSADSNPRPGPFSGAGIDLHFLPVTVVMDGRYTHGVTEPDQGSAGLGRSLESGVELHGRPRMAFLGRVDRWNPGVHNRRRMVYGISLLPSWTMRLWARGYIPLSPS